MNNSTNPYGYPAPVHEVIETPFGKLDAWTSGPHTYEQYGRTYNIACSIRMGTMPDETFVINGRTYNTGFVREAFTVQLHEGGVIDVDFGIMYAFTDSAREKLRQHFADGALFTPHRVAEATYRAATHRAASAWQKVHDLTAELTDAKILLVAANGEFVRAGQELEKVEGES